MGIALRTLASRDVDAATETAMARVPVAAVEALETIAAVDLEARSTRSATSPWATMADPVWLDGTAVRVG